MNISLEGKLSDVTSELKMKERKLEELMKKNEQLDKQLLDKKLGEVESQVTNVLLMYVAINFWNFSIYTPCTTAKAN